MSGHGDGDPPDPGEDEFYKFREEQNNNMEITAVSGIDNINKNVNSSSNVSKNQLHISSNSSQINTNDIRTTYKYLQTDTGPFEVIIENKSDLRLNAIRVGDIILKNWPELDNKIKRIDLAGKHRVKVVFGESKWANFLVDQNKSKRFTENKLEAYVPKFMIHRQGILRDIDRDISDEELKNKIKAYDYHCKFTVVEVKRLKRKIVENNTTVYVPTKSIIVTFRAQSLPKYVVINKVLIPVELFVQKVILCFNCHRYGHVGGQCRGKSRCFKCHGEHLSSKCTENPNNKCLQCNGDHLTTNFQLCPEYLRQKTIKDIMSQKNLTYNDAIKLIPNRTYANATTSENKTLNPQFPIELASQKAFPLLPSQAALPYSSGFSQSSPIDSHKYTIYRNPTKRARPQTPDPCINEAIKITKPIEIARLQGGILSQESYRENIIKTNEMSETETITLVFELVMDILKSLNRDNILNVQQFEVVNIIKDRLNKQGLSSQT